VRGDLIRVVSGLMKRKGKFDAIIVETTGLADPGPVAQTFFVDDEVKAKTELDSVTALVDARHVTEQLDRSKEAREQVAFADQIILNKTDLASEDELKAVEARLRRLNPLAPIHRAQRAGVKLDAILGRHGFDLERILEVEPEFLNPPHGEPGHVHDEHCGHDHHGHDHGVHHHHHGEGGHAHGDDIEGVALSLDRPVDARRFTMWMDKLLAEKGPDILRAKGIIDVKGEEKRLVFQAVHMILEGDFQRPWGPQEKRWSRAVFIGRNLDREALKTGFEACVA
jgi:G3E family GTPase